ncbi:TauD/TfdA dioxygenase family protein [Ascoidea rubescens DSM 1968]|uniref:Clavaminate synthase-like protein n=1 Tax=Ascoidea rubescens DSM 1968 TaxID=1344418 RepID=A0A1D2VLY8_9ASCO|nr:Clavaminate synthase-like protein [Ascoidea rubescens DSM 1968]ODV62565.1 Clavaminate synthase-like protein [Ascoidea rubescens DSM 1968]
MSLAATPLDNAPFGAVIRLPEGVTDPSKLSPDDFKLLEKALHTYLVVVIPNQKDLSPKSQFELTTMFDETCNKTSQSYGHGKTFRHEDSVLKKDGTTVPSQPQVQVIGNGYWSDHHGLDNFKLTQPSQRTFHHKTLTANELENNQTRFYRWHIDSALYELSPPKCTTLLGIHVPNSDEKQKIIYEDTNEVLELTKGATAFLSGKTAFDSLSPEDKELALNTTVVYAPHPYIFISPARATSDGITMVSENKERSFGDLPPWEESKVKKLPMVWTNPTTGKQHLQFHGCCAYKLINNKTGKETPLEETRDLLQRLYRPAISPENIYCHSWKEGDLVIFYNRGVSHSVTGEFAEKDKRLMHQCNIASGEDPVCVK